MKTVSTNKTAKAVAFLSQAIEANGFIFVSGQVHADKNWQLVGSSPQEKFGVSMENVRHILDVANCLTENIVKAISEVYAQYFGDILPAREAIGVTALPLGATIEVSLITAKGQQ